METQQKDFHHPFQPYEIQQQFMEGVYNCIENGQVGIFESPTGTGKSLSLICGTLTWLREHKRRMYDEAMTNIEVEDDEPEWIVEHAKQVRSHEIRHMRDEFEARLAAVRERERRARERNRNSHERNKRQKHAPERDQVVDGEDEYVLDEYNSDEDRADANSAYSTETTKLMQKMGLLPAKDEDNPEEHADELKVFFCSRTHSQLSQFIGELQRVKLPSSLPPIDKAIKESPEELRHLTLGSRKNLCINSEVAKLSSQTAVNERCVELQQKRTASDKKCSFLPNKESEDVVLDFRDHTLANILDIEDLAKVGSNLQVCPYYASRSAIGPAEMVTLPYPLLLQKTAREALGISLKGHIVVIDEAHNLMTAVEGIYSAQISDVQLARAKEGLMTYLQKFRNRLKGSNRSYVTQVVRIIDSLLQFTKSVASGSSDGAVTSPGALLAGKAVDQINMTKLVRYIGQSRLARKVEGYLAYSLQAGGDKMEGRPASDRNDVIGIPTLTSVQNFLMTLMNPSREGRFLWSKTNHGVQIQYLLLDPSEHFRDIVSDARAVILAGGTMSPMDDYKQQLFPYLNSIVTFSCGHLIPSSSLLVRAITKDSKGTISFSFKHRNDVNSARMGHALLAISSKVRCGMVVFLPSYGYLESVLRVWRSGSIMEMLEARKAVFLDSRTSSAEETFRAYSEAVYSDSRGAVLFSVLGGKLSEGINFSDDLGRCVVVVGLPYPNLETPEWRAKMQYLDDNAIVRGEVKGKASREHAENVCMRSVNQAIGRAIRHKNDWASILLFDSRYAEARIQAKLPGWIRSSVDTKATGVVDDVVKDVDAFFARRP